MCNNCKSAYQDYLRRNKQNTPGKPPMNYAAFRADDEMVKRSCIDLHPELNEPIQRKIRFFYNKIEVVPDLYKVEITVTDNDDGKIQTALITVTTIDGKRTLKTEWMDDDGTIMVRRERTAKVPLQEITLEIIPQEHDKDCGMILHELSMCRKIGNWRKYKELLWRLVNNMPYITPIKRHFGRPVYDVNYDPIHPTESWTYTR